MGYRRVQNSTPMRVIAVVSGIGVVGATFAGAAWWIPVTLGIVAVVLANASRLTVTVESGAVTAAFGLGWPRRTIQLVSIADVRTVENEWWTGWGIRKVHRGWMFNTSGRSAVELGLDGGRAFRIGTDDPDGLHAALGTASRT